MRMLGAGLRGAGVVFAAGMLLLGCKGKDNNVGNEAAMASPAAESAATATPAAAPSSALTDPQIAKIALSANSGDSARGRIAEQKASNAEVKAFGRMMVTDHTALNKQATALAKKLNVTPQDSKPDSDLVAKVQGMTQEVQGKSGADFDKTYMDQEVQIHQLVLDDLNNTLIPAAQNAELKQLLNTAKAGVEGHLKKAQEVQAKLK